MANDDAAHSEEVLHVTKADVEAKVQPNGMGDDLTRETVALKRRPVRGLAATDIKEPYR
jgi:hypothetical protein